MSNSPLLDDIARAAGRISAAPEPLLFVMNPTGHDRGKEIVLNKLRNCINQKQYREWMSVYNFLCFKGRLFGSSLMISENAPISDECWAFPISPLTAPMFIPVPEKTLRIRRPGIEWGYECCHFPILFP